MGKRGPKKGEGGRPCVKIDQEQFEEMCNIHCTREEIARLMKCSEAAVSQWCERTYKENFTTAYKRFSAGGKMSLRRTMFKTAHGTEAHFIYDKDDNPTFVPAVKPSATMQVWLSKQHLGMQDQPVDESRQEVYKELPSLTQDKESSDD